MIKLHIGCGNRMLESFINIDIAGKPQKKIDVRKGLPYNNSSVDYIFSEHFIEHLTREESVRFLEECYRVLKPGGVCRIATPDLDEIVTSYIHDNWIQKEWVNRFNYAWIPNKCFMLNLSLREWGHQYVFNCEDLKMTGNLAGFIISRRCKINESSFESLRGLESRKDSFVIEFIKESEDYRKEIPLISILIPAYHKDYFKDALVSALKQTYLNIEIIVCNDNPSSEIKDIVRSFSNWINIKYIENPENIGAHSNYLQCFELSRGKYIKFLNDDDLLSPDCVKKMVSYFEAFGDSVTLVTSKRNKINEDGKKLKDDIATTQLFKADSFVDGKDLGNFILRGYVNIVGEPTTVMFRKCDLIELKPNIFSLNGKGFLVLVDIVMWLNLLYKANAIYLSEPLSCFRIHKEQDQQKSHILYRCLTAWPKILKEAKSMGFLEKKDEFVEAIISFSKACKSLEDNNIFSDSQKKDLSGIRKDLESNLEGHAFDISKNKSRHIELVEKLDSIQRSEGWHGPLKYVYIKG